MVAKKKPFLIGVCGGSGSGKSTLSYWIQEKFKPEHVLVVEQDMYYKEGLDKNTNYDHPDAIDYDLLIADLEKLLSGEEIDAPVYDFETSARKNQVKIVVPKPIIVLEGILIYASPAVKNKLDYTIFVVTDEAERLARRTARDVKERGRTVASVEQQFFSQVQPMHQLYVEPFKNQVDFVFNSQDVEEIQTKSLKKLYTMVATVIKD